MIYQYYVSFSFDGDGTETAESICSRLKEAFPNNFCFGSVQATSAHAYVEAADPVEEPVEKEEVVDKELLRETLVKLREVKGAASLHDLYAAEGGGATSMKTLSPDNYKAMYLAAKKLMEG
jgi:hypothetical protein